MPYDPIRDAPGFRITLRRLAVIERLTSQAIVDLFGRNRARGDQMSISRATLDRFIQGEDITKIRELRIIHDILRSHATYGTYFEPEAPSLASAAAPAAFAMAGFLAAADAEAGDPGAGGARFGDLLAALPGQFVMMRRDHDEITVEKGVRISLLSLDIEAGGVVIQETQSYRTPDYDMPFEQTDRGQVFTHGAGVYFLMKEIGGTCVKFGFIEQTLPELERRQPVQYFQGHLMVVSRRGVFPRTRFAARRYSPNQHPLTSGILRLGEIGDSRAIEYLRRDYVEGGAALPA